MRENGFSSIPTCMLKLPPELYQLFGAIRAFDWQKEGEVRNGCTVAVHSLAEMVGKGERQTQRNLGRLVECGAIRIEAKSGYRRRIFCTPESFQWEKLFAQSERGGGNKIEQKRDNIITDDINDDTVIQVRSDADDENGIDIHSQEMTSSVTGVKVTCMSSHIDIKTNKIKQEIKHLPLSPPAPGREEKREKPEEEIVSEGKPPILPTKQLDIQPYRLLQKFYQSASGKLVLGDLIPANPSPEGFTGVLPKPLEQQWYIFLKEYNSLRKLSQEDLEQRVSKLGKYLALGKNYWVKDGKIITLRWFCNPIHQTRVYELFDEALAWNSKHSSAAVVTKIPSLPEIMPEELQKEYRHTQERLQQGNMPESSKEALTRILAGMFQQEQQNATALKT